MTVLAKGRSELTRTVERIDRSAERAEKMSLRSEKETSLTKEDVQGLEDRIGLLEAAVEELARSRNRSVRVLKDAELPAFRVYDCRHTFASRLLAAGAPISYVAAQLGHARPSARSGQ